MLSIHCFTINTLDRNGSNSCTSFALTLAKFYFVNNSVQQFSFTYQDFRQFWARGVLRSFYRKLKSSSPTKLLGILPSTTKSTKTSSNKVTKYLNNSLDHTPVFWSTKIPLENVAVMLKNLKVSKSTGLDKIPAVVLKSCFKCNCTIFNIHI